MSDPPPSHASHSFTRLSADGDTAPIMRDIAEEMPVAIEFNGIGYAVLMATPMDLEDLVIGFACAERLIGPEDAVPEVDIFATGQGMIARANLPPGRVASLHDRVRHRASESACGLCGIENLEQAIRPLPQVTSRSRADRAALFAALDALRAHQPLNARTGAAHAAAWADAAGGIRLVREDVGRHNGFDKLIGAMRRTGADWDGGFALLSSRCSYELVEKAALSDCPLLVTISAPTGLALNRARKAGLPLITLARSDAMLMVGDGEGVLPRQGRER